MLSNTPRIAFALSFRIGMPRPAGVLLQISPTGENGREELCKLLIINGGPGGI